MQTRQEAADALLSHEQGHFDITNVLAKKLEADIKSLVDGFAEKKVNACGKDEAMKQAGDIAIREIAPKIQDNPHCSKNNDFHLFWGIFSAFKFHNLC